MKPDRQFKKETEKRHAKNAAARQTRTAQRKAKKGK